MGRYSWIKETETPLTKNFDVGIRNSDRLEDPDLFLKKTRFPIYVFLENIRSAYNVGAVFRTSDSVRVKKLFLCGYTAYPPNDKLEKTSLGSTNYVPWEFEKDPLRKIKTIKNEGIFIASLETTDRSRDFFSFNFPAPVCLVLGNEINGVSIDILKESDAILEIPTWGIKNSLNVATTFGITVYEIVRQFRERNIINEIHS